jgi:hypothetical protein
VKVHMTKLLKGKLNEIQIIREKGSLMNQKCSKV